MAQVRHAQSLAAFTLFAALAVASIVLIPNLREAVRSTYEVISIGLIPDAERAALFGNRHLDSSEAAAYDLRKATFFFKQAIRLEREIPYARHQLARIAFLRGNFEEAMLWINGELGVNPESAPSSYYLRGLIRGYRGEFELAATDYERFLNAHPNNWAAINDYAWVLLKAGRAKEAEAVLEKGLAIFPQNAWLLNSSAIALFETGDLKQAYERAQKAVDASARITEPEWLVAYPGNDPKVAEEGIATLRRSAGDNMHRIAEALTVPRVQLSL